MTEWSLFEHHNTFLGCLTGWLVQCFFGMDLQTFLGCLTGWSVQCLCGMSLQCFWGICFGTSWQLFLGTLVQCFCGICFGCYISNVINIVILWFSNCLRFILFVVFISGVEFHVEMSPYCFCHDWNNCRILAIRN